MKPWVFLVLVLSFGCKPKSEDTKFVAPIEDRLATFLTSSDLTNLESRVSSIEWDNMVREQKWVLLDPTTKSYQRIDTSLTPLLVSVRNLTAYLDGYKMTVEIGNPYSMDFNGLRVSYKWGIPYKYSKGRVVNFAEAQASEKSKESDQTDILRSGWWNPIELTVTPATAEEIKNLRISITLNQISLYRKPEPKP